jgi:hypothetical protein
MGMYSQVGGSLAKPGERGKAAKRGSQSEIRKPTRYESLKGAIRIWWSDRPKILEALKEIHDTKLYKEEYGTFDDFCRAELGIDRTYAYRLLKAADIKESVKNVANGDILANEAQLRALGAVPEERREEVLSKAAESGPVTAKSITEAAQDSEPEAARPTETQRSAPSRKPCPSCGGSGYVQ